MTDEIDRNAHAVFLPAFGDLHLSGDVETFLSRGGLAVLPGESRDEYVARRMSTERTSAESAGQFQALLERAVQLAGHPVLVAVDQELGGIMRLHDLVPQLPTAYGAGTMTSQDITTVSRDVAAAAKRLGVNMFLSPIVDVVTGTNVWLERRTLSTDPKVVGRIASAFVRGVQQAGVVATAKHFPGHYDISADPATNDAFVPGTVEDLAPGYLPFLDVIAAGTKAIMTGPALVPALDKDEPASLSAKVIAQLRQSFRFAGMIVSDDLDSKATMRSGSLERAAIAALSAGSDLLLVAAGPHLADLVGAVAQATRDGLLAVDRLAEAASRVRQIAKWAA